MLKTKTLGNCTEVVGGGNIEPPRQRAYCFTSFAKAEPTLLPCMSYLCYSPEICPTTQREHWQGYMYFKSGKTMSAACRVWKSYNVSCQVANGTSVQNRIYCGASRYEKDGKIKEANPLFQEHGTLPSQGKRTDLDSLKDEILGGRKVDDIIVEQPNLYHQYGRTLNAIEDIALRKRWRTEMTQGIWYVGATGKGKSHRAFENYHPDTHYKVPLEDKGWWDGYRQQDTVIINDFRGSIAYDTLLNMVDKWPFDVPRRGKPPMPFISKTVIITSPLLPHEVYHNRDEKDDIAQLLRRFKIIQIS